MFSERRYYKYITLLFTLRRDSKGGDFGKLARKKCHYLTPEIMAFCAPPEIFPKRVSRMNIRLVLLIAVLIFSGIGLAIQPNDQDKTAVEKGFYDTFAYSMAVVISSLGLI